MGLYSYIKKTNQPRLKSITIFSYFSLVIGCLLLFWAFYPIISFKIYSVFFINHRYLSPVPISVVASPLEKANSILSSNTVFSNNLRDFTNVNLWFPNSTRTAVKKQLKIKEYYLSIPKLNIKDAKVVVDGEDLSVSLVQYLSKSLPGEYGNVIIFGHSTLPQLYNVKDYKTIFTYLPSLNQHDRVFIDVEGIRYEYEIYDMFVIDPDQISVLDEHNDAAYLTLITCVPPGTYWQRLVVRAKLTRLPIN